MRSHSAGMAAHLAGRTHSRCWMMRMQLVDGTLIGFTSHDKPILFDLGGMGELEYQAKTGILPSNIVLSADLDAGNFEIEGPIGDVVTREALLGGRFNRARGWLFQINWRQPEDQSLDFVGGSVTEPRLAGGRFFMEFRDDFDRYNQTVGEVITNNCKADHGDSHCRRVPENVVGTVTAVVDAMRFTMSYAGSFADGFFDAGTVQALTGDMIGTQRVEIHSWTAAGVVELFMPLVEAPAIGDTFNIVRGCGKSRADCMARNNILNFYKGFPETPGSDQVFRPTIPGQGND